MSSPSPFAWITHPACLDYDPGPLYAESAQRLQAVERQLGKSDLMKAMKRIEAPAVTREQLLRVHSARHIERQLDPNFDPAYSGASRATLLQRHEAALRAAGAGIKAVDMVLAKEARAAFCAVRPPGHHAGRETSQGFCYFNNVAVAAAHVLAQGIQRVAIVDFDLHYGNGTADIFMDEPRVRFYSTYQPDRYPEWITPHGRDHLVDVTLDAGSGSHQFWAAMVDRWEPEFRRQQPEFLLVSAGFDSHEDDPLGELNLTNDDYYWLGDYLRKQAERYCEGRFVSILEGGYELDTLPRSIECYLEACEILDD